MRCHSFPPVAGLSCCLLLPLLLPLRPLSAQQSPTATANPAEEHPPFAHAILSAPPIEQAAMRHLQAGLMMPLPPPATTDADAIAHFAAAAGCGRRGAEAVLALALTTPDLRIAARALTGARRAAPLLSANDHVEALLVPMLDHPQAETRLAAANVLGMHLQHHPDSQLVSGFVIRTLKPLTDEWEQLRIAPAPPERPYTLGVPANLETHIALMAALSGDTRLVVHFAESTQANAGKAPSLEHVMFTLQFHVIAAPHVDQETARQLHSWYHPHAAGWDTDCAQFTAWQRGVMDVLFAIHPLVPERLLASYDRILARAPIAEYARANHRPLARRGAATK